METALMVKSSVEAAGGIRALFSGVIGGDFEAGKCACEVMDVGARGELMG